jgi:predicted enzyme related to lactoylglutathione lyase
MTYFAFEDVQATCDRCTELGGNVAVPPFETPVGMMAVLNDPNGAVFSIGAFAQIDDPNAWE